MKKLFGIFACSSALLFAAESSNTSKGCSRLHLESGTLSVEGKYDFGKHACLITQWPKDKRKFSGAVAALAEGQDAQQACKLCAAYFADGVSQVIKNEVRRCLKAALESYRPAGKALALVCVFDNTLIAGSIMGDDQLKVIELPATKTMCIGLAPYNNDNIFPLIAWVPKK